MPISENSLVELVIDHWVIVWPEMHASSTPGAIRLWVMLIQLRVEPALPKPCGTVNGLYEAFSWVMTPAL